MSGGGFAAVATASGLGCLARSVTAMAMLTKIGKTTLRLVTGDIADQDTAAVVTAAHWRLNKSTGTDGTIHTKGGARIYAECQRIGACPIGDAVITTGSELYPPDY
jgi:O-acetyl-ADP-ribose deacetylase (regulator of RNase III)